jgi:hypothetical protein
LLIVRFRPTQHYFMRNHHNDPKKFQTDNSMSIVIYDEKKDDWAKILYSDALAEATKRVFKDGAVNQAGFVNPPENFIFTCRDTNYPGDTSHQFVKWWGQLEQGGVEGQDVPDHLPLEALRAHAASVEHRLTDIQITAIEGAIANTAALDEDDVRGRDGINLAGGQVDPRVLAPIIAFYPSLDFNATGQPRSFYAGFSLAVINLFFPRPTIHTADNASNSTAQGLDLQSIFGDAAITYASMGIGLSPATAAHEQRALRYLFEKDGLTKSQAKNFIKERAGKLKKSWEAALAATVAAARGNLGLLTRAAIRACMGPAPTRNHYIQWRKPGGTAGLVAVKDIADELLEAYPPLTSSTNGAAVLAAAIRGAAAVAHLGEEFSIGSKRPASSANEQWSKRQGVGTDAQDASAFMEGIGARFDKVKGRRAGAAPSAADIAKLSKHNWVMSSDYALFHAQNKVQHFARKVGNLSTIVQRIAAHCLYWSKVTQESMQTWAVNNIVPPFSLCLARPWMTYDMNTCILMKGGSETGNTFQGHSDFQLGDDVQSKIHYGNYTYYSKAIVTQHKNIIHARNVYCNGYVDGDDTDWARVNSNGDREGGSLLAFIVPYNEHKKSNPMRLFSESEVDPHVRPEHRFGRSMTGSQYYRSVLNFNHNTIVGADAFTTLSEQNDSNDITYQGHTFFWKEHREAGVNGSYTGVTVNTGHWGRDVYPGCGRVRNGEEVYFEKQHHGQDVY